MNNTTPFDARPSVRELAARELANENREKALKGMKELLRRRAAAQTVVDNIDREIADYEAAIEQGNLTA